jgi:hypothetical protein
MEDLGMKAPIRPRVDPTFEGDRKWRELRAVEIAEAQEEEELVTHTGGPSDYAQPEVRALQNLEAEVTKLAERDPEYKRPEQSRTIGNSTGMKQAQHILNNTVTAAHDDACKAVDAKVEEGRALMARLERAAENHKARLKEGGQKIALDMESAMQALSRTVEWFEKQAPDLHNPKLDTPKEETPTAER